MRLSITPTIINGVSCSEAEVYIAISNSLAMRIVPLSPDGVEQMEGTMAVVGTADQADISVFLDAVSTAAASLLSSRGA